jgi:hypothetical protein
MSLSFGVAVRILCCMLIAVIFIYGYIEKQNKLTEVKLMIPVVAKELKAIQEGNVRLRYAIDSFENPTNLMKLAKRPEYSHLKFQLNSEVLLLPSNSNNSKSR